MARGWSNKLIGQAGEFAVCAQLAKRGLLATPFAGNVPGFDVIATSERLKTVPIQVKATFDNDTWISDARAWSEIEFDEDSGVQTVLGPKELLDSNLVMVYVVLTKKPGAHDRFFVLTKGQVRDRFVAMHAEFLAKHGGRRPRKPDSFHTALPVRDLEPFEDNWGLIERMLE